MTLSLKKTAFDVQTATFSVHPESALQSRPVAWRSVFATAKIWRGMISVGNFPLRSDIATTALNHIWNLWLRRTYRAVELGRICAVSTSSAGPEEVGTEVLTGSLDRAAGNSGGCSGLEGGPEDAT